MGGRRGGEDFGEGGRPVEPGEARTSGNDPDAVRIHRRGGADDDAGDGAGGRSTTGRRDDAEREETVGRVEREGTGRRAEPEEVGARSEDREASGGGDSGGMERSDKVLISALAVLGVVLLAVMFVLSLLRSPEWIQFVLALALFAVLGLGAYRYVITPSGRRQESRTE